MKTIVVDQNFHGIGQGLFYSGKITLESNNMASILFNFIYDCGTLSQQKYLNKEISEYKLLNLQNNDIDLLVISHLHSDHVNGLNNLLENTNTKNVVLPYLNPFERILLSIYSKGPRWYFEFIFNPSNFLNKKGVKNIIYLSQGENIKFTPPETSENINKEIEFPTELKLNFEKMEDDDDTKKYVKSYDNVSDWNVKFKKDSYPAILTRIWQFYFYTSPIDKKRLHAFQSEVEQLQSESSITEILRDENKRNILKEIYKKRIREKINFTSLTCLHGPLYLSPFIDYKNELNLGLWPIRLLPHDYHFYKELKYLYREIYNDFSRIFHDFKIFLKQRSYSFLMGDINSIFEWDNLKSRYQRLFKHIQSLQIPHHGSRHNWNNKIPLEVGPCYYIISAGLRNRFRHPDPQVIQNISQNFSPELIKWAHEYQSQMDKKLYFI